MRELSSYDVVHDTPGTATVTDHDGAFPPERGRFIATNCIYVNEFAFVNNDTNVLTVIAVGMLYAGADDAALAAKARDARQTRFHRVDVSFRWPPSNIELRQTRPRTRLGDLLSSALGKND